MKRVFTCFLVLLMTLTLLGCGQEKQEDTSEYGFKLDHETFSVGYSRIDITPELAVPMAGYGNPSKRLSQNI